MYIKQNEIVLGIYSCIQNSPQISSLRITNINDRTLSLRVRIQGQPGRVVWLRSAQKATVRLLVRADVIWRVHAQPSLFPRCWQEASVPCQVELATGLLIACFPQSESHQAETQTNPAESFMT